MKIILYKFIFIIGWSTIMLSCNRRNDYNGNVEVIREWNFQVSSSNQNFVTPGKEISGTFHMVVLADNSVRYDVRVDSAADRIVTAKINLGDPVSEGPLLMNLPVRVYSTYASGVLTGLSRSLIDTLINNNIEKYINVTSDNAPAGLVRGQLNTNLIFSKNVQLTGGSVVPPVTTTVTGNALVRLTSDNVLYSKVMVENNDPADPVTTATINRGTSRENGPVVLTLVSSPQEFGVGKKTTITPANSSAILTNNTYVIVSSASNPNGKVRGQMR